MLPCDPALPCAPMSPVGDWLPEGLAVVLLPVLG